MQEAERSLHLDLPVEQIQMVRGWMALLHAGITYSKGDLRQSVMYAQEALRWFPENEEHWRAAVTSFANYSYLVSGDVRSAMEQQIVAAICGPGNLYTQLRQTANLARLQSMQGRLHQAALTYAQAEQRFPEHISLYAFAGTPAYSFGLGDVLREWNRLDEAEYHLTEGIELVRQTWLMDTHVILLGYVSLARLKLARRAFAEALSVLEEFSHLAQERDYNAVFIAQGVAIQMQIELAQGNLARAIRWADERTWPLEGEPLNYLCEREYLVMARVRIAQGRKEPKCALLHEVLGVLDRILKDAETKSRKSSVIEVLLLRALTFAVLDDRTQALLSLDRALQLAEPEGYIRLFIDEGKVMEALLHQAQAHGSAVDYVGALLAAYCTQRETVGLPGMSPSGGLIEPLTEREREVLRLLVAGLSNAAIAEKLVITVGTVKRHINSIYGKLGVNSRPQAIRCAHMLGLL
jgi:LuxR family maltose regulon positive regulatory protein